MGSRGTGSQVPGLRKAVWDSPGRPRPARSAEPGRLERACPDARLVVPGHGAPGGRELLRHTPDLLTAAR